MNPLHARGLEVADELFGPLESWMTEGPYDHDFVHRRVNFARGFQRGYMDAIHDLGPVLRQWIHDWDDASGHWEQCRCCDGVLCSPHVHKGGHRSTLRWEDGVTKMFPCLVEELEQVLRDALEHPQGLPLKDPPR